jgi:hypothetical protein
MTKHSDTRKSTDIVVVDGSNIATEGRSMPSLSQLNDAVTSFLEENPEATITVVVDATFGHRIPKKETKEFDEAVANNELVAPPAGAIGRGDAFVLSIANKVGARVLSNDSFQEFHGDNPWLFDEGRLIGGKPVPNIGWVFVPRVPVQGARSRKAQRDAKTKSTPAVNRRSASAAASEPLPVPTKPPPSKRATAAATKATKAAATRSADTKTAPAARAPASGPAPVNDTLPFLEFVEKHPIGTSVNAEVESYSSHGAYAIVGDVRAYIPLALMDEPAPRSARSVMSIGEALVLVVAAFSPSRRSIDLAFPHMMSVDGGTATEAITAVEAATFAEPAKPAPRRKRAAKAVAEPVEAVKVAVDEAAAELAPEATKQVARARSKRATAAKKATPRSASAAKKPAAKPASASTAKPASKRTPARKPAATSTAKATAAAETPASGRAPAAKKPAAKKTTGRKTPAKKATAKKTTSKQTTTKQEGND